MKTQYITNQNPKSQTLWQSYRRLNQKMNAPSITPERRAELRPLSDKLKELAKAATNVTPLTPEQKHAVEQIAVLRAYSYKTGLRTTFSQHEILKALNPTDLAVVLTELFEGDAQ